MSVPWASVLCPQLTPGPSEVLLVKSRHGHSGLLCLTESATEIPRIPNTPWDEQWSVIPGPGTLDDLQADFLVCLHLNPPHIRGPVGFE